LKMNNDTAYKVIVDLIKADLLPTTDFEITEFHLQSYIKLYTLYKGYNESWAAKQSNIRYARKLAGLTLIKYKLSLGLKSNQCKEGFVYTVSNPAWPNMLKLGMTINVKERLSKYQTYSPFRDYKVEAYEFVFNRRETEAFVKDKFKLSIEAGEWISGIKASQVIKSIS